jgi:hypothetical protein
VTKVAIPLTSADPDPRPQAPERPLPSDCCDSGCPVCVHDLYAEELRAYAQALGGWQKRQAAPGDPPT